MSWLSNQLNNIGISDNMQTGVLTAMNPALGINQAMGNPAGGALGGILGGMFGGGGGGPSTNFNYDPATATAQTSAGQDMGFLNQAMGQMGGQAGLMNQTANQIGNVSDALWQSGQNFLNQGQSFADGSNPMYARMRQNMMGDLSSQATMGARQGMEALAGMGGGSKGMRDIIAGKQSNTAMQQVGGGYESMLNQGLGMAQTYGQMGMQGQQGAGNLLNMAGGLQQGAGGLYQGAGNLGMAGANLGQANNQFNAGQQNQIGMFNADAQNQATEFGIEGAYNAQFNEQQRDDAQSNNWINAGVGLATAKLYAMCIPEGTMIDTPDGSVEINNIRAGDMVIGFDGEATKVLQKHEYAENPETERFLKIHLDNGTKLDTCDMHKINDIRAKYYNIGDYINDSKIIKVDWYGGVERSFDLLTEDEGYQISGVPINSMIEELNAVANLIKEAR